MDFPSKYANGHSAEMHLNWLTFPAPKNSFSKAPDTLTIMSPNGVRYIFIAFVNDRDLAAGPFFVPRTFFLIYPSKETMHLVFKTLKKCIPPIAMSSWSKLNNSDTFFVFLLLIFDLESCRIR